MFQQSDKAYASHDTYGETEQQGDKHLAVSIPEMERDDIDRIADIPEIIHDDISHKEYRYNGLADAVHNVP